MDLRIFFALICLLPTPSLWAKRLALTFDDSPRLASPLLGVEKRAQKIRDVLREAGVKEVLFLATPAEFTPKTKDLLAGHGKAGHLIGNHTHSHESANEIDPKAFIADVKAAHEFLKDIPGFTPFFRFPFLREGSPRATKDELSEFLKRFGYRRAYVTIDTSEWLIEEQLHRALAQKKKVDYEKLKRIYLDTLVNSIEFYDDLATATFKREVKHTLLLHENELAGLFLADLIVELRRKGWELVSPTDAYSDPLAELEPKTLLLNQGRVMALAIDRGYTGPQRSGAENREELLEKIRKEKVFF